MKKQFTYAVLGVMALSVSAIANVQAAMPTAAQQAAPTAATATAPTQAVDAKAAKKMRLQNAVAGLEQSLETRIMNLEGLALRIQTRITKIQSGGKDMSAASAKLAEAQAAIAAARTELANLKKANVAMIASAKPATAFASIKAKTAKNVVIKIKAAHKALVDAIVIMKGQGTPGAATTTAQ